MTLAGQAHTAEGPLDMSGMYLMHHAFRRDLDRFVVAVQRTPPEDVEAWRALAVRWERFGSTLHHHHEVEDRTLWPPLLTLVDAASDAGARRTLEAMQAEHRTIDPQLAACGAQFAAMVESPTAGIRYGLVDAMTAIRDSLARHLAHEETDTLPLIQRALQPEAWNYFERAAQKAYRPRELAFLVPWAADGLDPETLARAFGSAGWIFRVLFLATRGRFAKREAVAFRYA
jgi:iron-sulfur cluster repair protein YtfE (RIC family)